MDPELAAFLKNQEPAPQAEADDVLLGRSAQAIAGNRRLRPEGTRRCPICEQVMKQVEEYGFTVDVCEPHGLWFDAGEFEELAKLRTSVSHDAMAKSIEDLKARLRWERWNVD